MLQALPSGSLRDHLHFLYVRAVHLISFGEDFKGHLDDRGYEAWKYDQRNQLWYEIEIDPLGCLEERLFTCAHEMGHILHDYLQDWPRMRKGQRLPNRPVSTDLIELSCDQFALHYLAHPGVREELAEILEPLYTEPYRVEFPLAPNPPRPAP